MPAGRPVDPAELARRARDGDVRAVARLISLIEDESPMLREISAELVPHAGRPVVIGLTGPPGVGKSTTVSALVGTYRSRGHRVGVLAVDPSSPFSGGALLGDRVRMQEHATDSGVYIRSMSSRGHLGGLAWSTPQALRVLGAAGCEVILIETVGVGQSEVAVAGLADTTVVLLAPGMGDAIQAAKAGVLEIGDIYAVNKSDREGADATVRDLRTMISLGEARQPGDWRPPVVRTVAHAPDGLAELVAELDKHQSWLESSDQLADRQRRRIEDELLALARADVLALVHAAAKVKSAELARLVWEGSMDPYDAAASITAEAIRAD